MRKKRNKEKRKEVIDQEKSDITTGMQGYKNRTELSVSHDINDLIQSAFVCRAFTIYKTVLNAEKK